MIVALVDELEEAEADDVLAMVIPLVAEVPRYEIDTRRRLAHALAPIDRERARAQLQLAQARVCAVGIDVELDIAALSPPRVDDSLARAARRVDDPELAARMEASLAVGGGEEAEQHARKALEHATRTGDRQLIEETTLALCELLVAREALSDARTLIDVLALDTPAAEALRDELRRRAGEYVADPPEETDEIAQVDPHVLAYVRRPHNLPQSIVDGGLPDALKISEWAHGTIARASELESQPIFGPVRAYWCACGRYRGRRYAGLVCARCGVEVIHSSSRRTRCARLVLDRPVIHPWYAPAAAQLLDRTIANVDELRVALRALDLDALVAQIKEQIVTAPKARVADQAGRRLALVEAFRRAHERFLTRPESIVLEVILVVPPHGDFGFDRAKVREAYAAVIEQPGQRSVDALFAAFA